MIVNLHLFKSGTLILLCLLLPIISLGQTSDSQFANASTKSGYFDDLKRFLQNFNEAYKEARDLGNQYRLTRVLMEDQVRDLEAVVPVNKPKVVQIESKIKALKKQEKVAQSNLKKYRKYAQSLEGINELSLKQQQKLIATVEAGYQKMPRVFAPPSINPLATKERPMVQVTNPANSRSDGQSPVRKPKKGKKGDRSKKPKKVNQAQAKRNAPRPVGIPTSTTGYATYDRSKDVNFNPPAKDCTFQFKGMDEFLGKEKTEVQPDLFFFHTDPELRKYMKGKEYIQCTAGLANSSGGVTTLNIEVYIRSPNALREFGGLQKGNAMTIKLVNGDIVKLLSINSDNGRYDESTGLATFTTQYLVTKGEENQLRESEIDKIRLVWSNGYEDYNVYEVDFIMNQLNCLYSD